MSRRGAIAVAILVLAGLPGCRVFDRLTKERDKDKPPADTASNTKDTDKDWLRNGDPGSPPKDWLAGPAPPGRGNSVPPAASDPASRGSATQRGISGVVEDADGRPVPNLYVTVENADPLKAGYGAPMGVETDRDGFFEINGLNANEHYMLSAQLRGNPQQAGRIAVQVPNSKVHLRLKEDYQLPPARSDNRPASDLPPPKPIDTPTAPPVGNTNPNNQDWSPLGPGGSKPPDTPPVNRGDLTAPGPQPDWRSTMPPASIPGPNTAPSMNSPTVPAIPAPPFPGQTAKTIQRDARLMVLAADGKPRNVLTGKPDDLVLLEFMTTTCVPCKKAVPVLASFSEKYKSSVEVVAIVCDDQTNARRVDLAGNYRRENRIPYAVNTETTRNVLQDQFSIEAYPTLVLLDGTGRRLWKGHPKDIAEVERIIRNR